MIWLDGLFMMDWPLSFCDDMPHYPQAPCADDKDHDAGCVHCFLAMSPIIVQLAWKSQALVFRLEIGSPISWE